MSIKNQVATLVAHIHIYDNLIIKTLHYTINITSTEAKFFAIRCDINKTTQIVNINCIIVIIDSTHATKRIFDSSVYPYQIQLSTISRELREFFKRDQYNSIEFWNCPSCDKWILYYIVNKEIKKFDLIPIFLYKFLWKFDRKNKCDKILNIWKIMFQFSNTKERQFLELLDDDLHSIKPSYSKGGL